MRPLSGILILISVIALSCGGPRKTLTAKTEARNDTVRIANDSLEYEIIIIDPGFTTWLNTVARPRQYYGQSYLEARNRVWVIEWNRRTRLPMQFGDMYLMEIDYRPDVNYGYEVNYLLFNYLVYFQQTNGQRLGTFQANP